MRVNGRVTRQATVVAVGVTSEGERQVLGIDVGPSEDRAFWTAFLRSLVKRGLRGVRLVTSDAHEGLKQAIATVLSGATWQRSRVHCMRNLLATIPLEAGVRDVALLRDRHVEAFFSTLPTYLCCNGYRMRHVAGTRGAHRLMQYLRTIGVTPPEPPTVRSYSWILDEWTTFLRQHQGLVPASVTMYRGKLEAFLTDLGADAAPDRFATLTPDRVARFVQQQAPHFARTTRKDLVITLRSFLRFAWSRGYLARDLSDTLIRVPCFSQERLPRGPKWADLAKLLTTVDRATIQGRRDFAISLTLITYGIRASQVAGLSLDDLDWRASTMRVPAVKRGRRVEVPMTPAVGHALIEYVREGRPTTAERRIFLSLDPPFPALARGSIYNIVAKAFRRAGIVTPHWGSHAIRHAWATRALAQGQRLKTIADLLGHRSLESTRIYAKLDVGQLRAVGLSWPAEEVPS